MQYQEVAMATAEASNATPSAAANADRKRNRKRQREEEMPVPQLAVQRQGSDPTSKHCQQQNKRGRLDKQFSYFSRSESVRRSGKRLAAKRSAEGGESENAKLKGKLKIALKPKSGCLTIHVYSAKQLQVACRAQQCDLYVRISLVTGGKEVLSEFTPVQKNTKEPKFDRTFYIPLELVRSTTRLVIHLNRQTGKRFDDIIGCMSFGMKNLISSSKGVSGWYYLLRDDVGRTKHLKASKEEKELARSRRRGKLVKRKREEEDTGDRPSSVLRLDASTATQPDLRTSGWGDDKLVNFPGLPGKSYGAGRVDGGSHTSWPIKSTHLLEGDEKVYDAGAKQNLQTFPNKPSSELFSDIQAQGGKENSSNIGVSARPEPPANAKEVNVNGEKPNWLRRPLHFLSGTNLPEGKDTLGNKKKTLLTEAPNNDKKVGSAGGKRTLENCQLGAFHTFPGSRPAEVKVGRSLGQGFFRCPQASTGIAIQGRPVLEDYPHQGSSKDILNCPDVVGQWKGSRGDGRRSSQGTLEEGQSTETDSAYMDRPDPLLSWITLHYVVLCKDASGKYGFTLLDTLPVQVGSVEKGSQAEAAGLQKGDYFLEIGGYNVAGINSRGIKDILKQTHSKIDALVQRHSDPTTRPSIPPRPSKLRRKHHSEKEEEARKNLHNNRLRSVKQSAARAAALTRKRGLLLMGYSGSMGNLSPVSLVQKRLKRELIATVAMRRKRMLPEKVEEGKIILEREPKDGDFLGERKGPDGRWSSSTDAMTSDSGGDEIIPRWDTSSGPDAQVNADVALVSSPYRESVRDSGRLSVRDLILEPLKQSPQSSPQDSFRESLKDAVRAQAIRNSFQEAAKEFSNVQGSPKETATSKASLQDLPSVPKRNSMQDLPSVPRRNSEQETARTASQSLRKSTVYENAWIMMPRKNTKSENQIYEKATCSCSSCPQTPPRSPMRKLSEEFNRQIIVQPKLPMRHSPDGEASMLLSELKDSPYELPILLPQEKQLAKSSTTLSDLDVAVTRPLKPSLSERQLTRPPIVMERKRSLPQLTKSGSSDLVLHQSAMTISELNAGEDVQEPPNAARRLAKVAPVMRKTSRSKSEDYLGATLLPHSSDPDLYANNHILKKGKSQSFAALSQSLRREGNAKPPVPSRVYVNEKIGRATWRDVGASSHNASVADSHGDEDVDDSAVKMRCSFAQYGRMEEVLFTKGVEPFTLGPPDRELIHAGRLFFFNKRKKFREVLAMVFNDALVIARSQHQDGRLRVIFPRLLILDISLLNFNCENAREFSITPVLSSSGHEAACHHGSIIFRAPSVKLKRSWQRVLTQQVMAVKYTSLGKLKTTVRTSVTDPQSSSNHGNSVVQPSPAKVLNNNTSVSSADQGVDSLLHYSPPCRMVESLNNNHSVEEKDDDMRTFSLLQDTRTAAATTTNAATTVTDAKMSQECATLDDQSMQELETCNQPEIGPHEALFESSVEHKNNSNHARQDFFDSYDPTSTIIPNDEEDGDPCLSSTHSSPTLSHHECFQVDNATYSAPSSPHGKQPLSRHPKKKLVRRQSSPPTSTANADADEPERDEAVPPDSPGTRVKFRRSFFKRFSAGNKEELQGKTRALSVRERSKVQKKTQPESKKKARRTFSVGDDQLMRIRQQQTTAKSTNSNSNIFASVKEEDEAGSPAQSSSLLPGQPVANQQESAFEDVFSPNSLTETQKKARNIARDLKDKMRFLRRRHTDSSLRDTNKFNVEKVNFPEVEDVRKWGESFENLLRDKNGLEAFRKFLQTEFSDENIEFWLACEDYKKLKSSKYATRARKIYDDYVTIQAPREVNLDSRTRLETVDNLNAPDEHTFDQAQKRIEALMEKDSYPRFLRSEIYQKILRESSKKGK